jgi:hypothetical protein
MNDDMDVLMGKNGWKIDSLSIDFAENGVTVNASFCRPRPAKGKDGDSYESTHRSKRFVFDGERSQALDKALEKMKEIAGEGGSAAEDDEKSDG